MEEDKLQTVNDFVVTRELVARVFSYSDQLGYSSYIIVHYCKGNLIESPWANIKFIKTFNLGDSVVYERSLTGYHLSGIIKSFTNLNVLVSPRSSTNYKRVNYTNFLYYNRLDDEEIQHDNYAAMMNT